MKPESGLELSYQDYQRGLFSSHLQLVVKPIAGQANGCLPVYQAPPVHTTPSATMIPAATSDFFIAFVHKRLVHR
jgi:hypothetical protein